jgi:hypothetical protein
MFMLACMGADAFFRSGVLSVYMSFIAGVLYGVFPIVCGAIKTSRDQGGIIVAAALASYSGVEFFAGLLNWAPQ